MRLLTLVVVAGFAATIVLLYEMRGKIMAFGNETKAALEELDAAISTEFDEFTQYVINASGADNALAAAIRERAEKVKSIITASVEEGEVVVPEPQNPVEDPEDPVEPEAPVEEPERVTPTTPAEDVPALTESDEDNR